MITLNKLGLTLKFILLILVIFSLPFDNARAQQYSLNVYNKNKDKFPVAIPDSIYVGCIPVGDTLEGNVVFTNANSYTLTIKEIKQYGSLDFELDGTPSLPKTVAPAATAKIGIRFIPRSAEQFNGLLTVVYQTDDAVVDSVSTKIAGCGLDLGVEEAPESFTLPENSTDYTHASVRLRSSDEKLFIQSLTPNPATTVLRCVYACDIAGDIRIELLDMLGNVAALPIPSRHHVRGVFGLYIDVSNLASGTYIMRISGSGYIGSGRVIIAR